MGVFVRSLCGDDPQIVGNNAINKAENKQPGTHVYADFLHTTSYWS